MGFLSDVKTLANSPKDDASRKVAHPPKTVLVVEDEKALANVLSDRLTREGFHVISAGNGEEGLAAITSGHPDVVILDLLMPVMDGKAMLHHLRDMPDFKKLPVIVLTNAGESDNMRETQRYLDAVEFLIKSNVTLDQIVEKVKMIAW